MIEQEIKLHVPAASRKAVEAQLQATSGPRRIRLRAMYFDTASRSLARQQAALRLRLEGRRWVQTFKMAGADTLSRMELNHPRPGPELDLSVYADTPAQAILAQLEGDLALRYETDVMRLARDVETPEGVVEVAYDVGSIRAGELEIPVSEIEFEMVSGEVQALFTLAAGWVGPHGLVMDLRSKAERGDGLASADLRLHEASMASRESVRAAEIRRFWAPAMAAKLQLDAQASPAQALATISASCHEQIARNATLLAEVDTAHLDVHADAEHVHQLRVAMRRLRSAWRLFDGWAPQPGAALQEGARHFFGLFGQARDADVLGETVVPALERAGMPSIALPQTEAQDAAAVARSPAFQRWLLEVLAWTVELARQKSERPPEKHALRQPVTRRLCKWHRRLLKDGRRFAQLDDEARHDLRKLAKRLRYGLSFTESLYSETRTKTYRKRLAAVQDVLGEVNDLVVARETYAAMTESEPRAWFAVGWATARLDRLYREAEEAIAALGAAKAFWR